MSLENMVKINNTKFKNKKILIIGNTGFVGSWLTITLNLLRANVLGLSLKMKDKKYISNSKEYKKNINTIYTDIRNLTSSFKKIKKFKPEIVFHLASQPLVIESYLDIKNTFEVNVLGTVEIFKKLSKIKSIKQIIVFTSDKVYKNSESFFLNESSPLGGLDPYSSSKSCQDIISASFFNSIFNKKINMCIVRSGNLIGGGDWAKHRLIPDFFKSIMMKEKLVIRNPKAVRPWLHILDLINGMLKIIIKRKKIGTKSVFPINFAPNKKSHISVSKIINKINKINNKGQIKFIKKRSSHYESKVLLLSALKAKKELNWKPLLKIDKSLELTSNYYNAFIKKKANTYKITSDQIKNFFIIS